MILDLLEAAEKSYCDGSEEEQAWLAGSISVISGIAEFFGIELNSMKKDGNHNTKMDEKNEKKVKKNEKGL